MPDIEQLIMQNDFYHVFQPIYEFPERSILGYEALIRSKSNIYPDLLFQYATEQNNLFKLDSLSITQAISTYFSSPNCREHSVLFINIFPSTLVSPLFIGLLEALTLQFEPYRRRIVFEINESIIEGALWKSAHFMDSIRLLRELNFLIALDDVGEGTTSFRNILDISPDFIKIDRFFSDELYTSRKKQKIIELFVEYCNDDSSLILEGIEKEADLDAALSLGVRLGQGYLLGRPGPLT